MEDAERVVVARKVDVGELPRQVVALAGIEIGVVERAAHVAVTETHADAVVVAVEIADKGFDRSNRTVRVDADDIFQDFFIQVWEKRDSFQVSSSVKGYLLIWLRNHILNSIKQEQIRDKYQDICAPNEEDNYTWVKIVAKDLDENIRRIVDGFPPRLQCVYMLRQEQNLSIKEIAEKLAVSEQTVKNQLGDITRRLRCEVGRKNFLFFI